MLDDDRSYSMAFHTRGADFRAIFVSAASAINAAVKQVEVDQQALYHFSELVVCTNLLAGLFREVQDITLDIQSQKYLQSLVVEATPEGIFRAACQTNPEISSITRPQAIDEDLHGAIMHVIKRHRQASEPAKSTIGSQSKSVPNLVQQFLHESEQISTLMLTGMKLRNGDSGDIEAERCFGLLIEALPEVSEEKKFIITDNLERLTSLTQYFSGGEKDVMDLLDDIYPGEQWIENSEVALVYRCRCHREGYLEKLVQIARNGVEELFGDQEELEVRCGYCSNVFTYPRAEIEARLNPQ